jgi:hypothetical protein
MDMQSEDITQASKPQPNMADIIETEKALSAVKKLQGVGFSVYQQNKIY